MPNLMTGHRYKIDRLKEGRLGLVTPELSIIKMYILCDSATSARSEGMSEGFSYSVEWTGVSVTSRLP